MAEKAKELVDKGSEIYQGNLSDVTKKRNETKSFNYNAFSRCNSIKLHRNAPN